MKQKQKAPVNNPLKAIGIKVVLLGVTLAVVLSLCIYMTVAWYTKMVSVSGLEFKVAEWDFTANYAVDDIVVNVYEYSTITWDPDAPLAAPGTAGYIPVKLGAWQSDTDINFTLTIDRSTMSVEFQNRIFFYYLKTADGSITNVETDDTTRVYLHGSPADMKDKLIADIEQVEMKGTVKKAGEREILIFWEWLYEAPEGSTEAVALAWDEFDTAVGKNPTAYRYAMNAKITIAGVQATPVKPGDVNQPES